MEESKICNKRRLKLHTKLARNMKIGIMKRMELCENDKEDIAMTDTLRRSLEALDSTADVIQEKANSLRVPLALAISDKRVNPQHRRLNLRQRRLLHGPPLKRRPKFVEL